MDKSSLPVQDLISLSSSYYQAQLLAGEKQVMKMILNDEPLPVILTAIVRLAESLFPHTVCSITRQSVLEQHLSTFIAPSLPSSLHKLISDLHGYQPSCCEQTTTYTACYSNALIIKDIQTDPDWIEYRDICCQQALHAIWLIPACNDRYEVPGYLSLCHKTVCCPNEQDWSTLWSMAQLFSWAVEQHREEARLQESENLFRTVTENDAMLVCILQDDAVVYANPYTHKLLSANKALVLWQMNADDISPTSLILPNFREIAIHDESNNLICWLGITTAPTVYRERPALLKTGFDITTRKYTEESLHFIMETTAMRTGDNLFQTLLTYIGNTFNQALVIIGELVDNNFIHTLCAWKEGSIIDDFTYALVDSPCETVIREARLCIYPQHVAQQFPKDTMLADLQAKSYLGVPLRDVQGHVIGLVLMIGRQQIIHASVAESLLQSVAIRVSAELGRSRAFTILQAERAQLEQRVNERTQALCEANQQLADTMQAKDAFLTNMSHELRTPLHAILSGLEIVCDPIYDHTLNDMQQQTLKFVEESGQHLLLLINDLLDIAKIEAGKMMLDMVPVDLHSLAESSLRMVRGIAAKKNIRLDYDGGDNQVLYADGRRLKQVLVNLLGNAMKFTPENGRVSLKIQPVPARGELGFIISDTGIGIVPEDIERLFLPFTQLGNCLTKEYEGSGLGLALVQALVRLHKGRIEVNSQPGQGSQFTVWLPWQAQQVAFGDTSEFSVKPADFLSETVADWSMSAAARDGYVVLVAEDNRHNCRILIEYLTLHGYSTLEAEGEEQIVRQVLQHKPDIILIGIQMPYTDSLDTIQRLRSVHQVQIPVIALTALAMRGDRERVLAAQADECISKPFSLQTLLKTVDSFLLPETLNRSGQTAMTGDM